MNIKQQIATLAALVAIITSEPVYAFPSLVGQILSKVDYKSVAVFKKGEKVFIKRIGDRLDDWFIVSMKYRYIYLQNDAGEKSTLMVGDIIPTEIRTNKGLERSGNMVLMTSEFRNYIANENLINVMMDAASEPVVDEYGLIGFRLFEIEPDSVYELIGIEDNDVITHIDDIPLDSAWVAIRMLRNLKMLNEFSFTYLRKGHEFKVNVGVSY